MLKEGNKYEFLIQRVIEMPPDGEEHYVLESLEGLKFLMLKKYYDHYRLQPGQHIVCKVDKVNCSGRIFLEPEHPYCKPGDLVEFKNLADVSLINAAGSEEHMLVLQDPWEQGAQLNITGALHLAKESTLTCRVERIKKGQLLVSCPQINYFGKGAAPEPAKDFLVKEIRTLAEHMEFFVLEQDGSFFYLRTKYYTKYGFGPGDRIRCRALDRPSLFYHHLEPEHPHYQPGLTYWFDFIRKERSGELTDRPHHRLVVQDLLGHEYPLIWEGDLPAWISRVQARVAEIRMSKCTLEIQKVE